MENVPKDVQEKLGEMHFERMRGMKDHGSLQNRPLPAAPNQRKLSLPSSSKTQNQWTNNTLPKPTVTLFRPPEIPLPKESYLTSINTLPKSPPSRSPLPPEIDYTDSQEPIEEEDKYFYDEFFSK